MPGADRRLLSARVYLVQILLPVNRNDGSRQPDTLFHALRDELVARFGGLTAYTRAPAVGLWADDPTRDHTERDELVIVEVMAHEFDRVWWTGLRHRLERRFEQQEIVVRALPIEQV